MKALTPTNILSGFHKTGIFPLNRDVFCAADFIGSSVTDRPNETEQSNPQPESTEMSSKVSDQTVSSISRTPENQVVSPPRMPEKPMMSQNFDLLESSANSSSFISPHEFKGFPKAENRKRTQTRKTKKSVVLTNSPDLDALKLEAANKKMTPQNRKRVKVNLNTVNSSAPKQKKNKRSDSTSSEESEELINYEDSSGDECDSDWRTMMALMLVQKFP